MTAAKTTTGIRKSAAFASFSRMDGGADSDMMMHFRQCR
tara:strand:+ start:472 stop:588 length:117 start_codon:yes stop_codon:yes gene_type:complete